MRLNCPACGAAISLDALITHDGAREAIMIALQLPAPLGKALIQYIALFRPGTRQLSMDRVASLLGELLPMINEGRIERSARKWSAPNDYWLMAIEDMLARRDSLTLPLKSHGYLLEIIAGFSNKAEAKREQQQEQARKYGADHKAKPAAKAVMPESIREQIQRFTTKGKAHGSNQA